MTHAMIHEAAAMEAARPIRTERGGSNGLRYSRMTCPSGVSMTSIVTLVPMEYARSYMEHEIASEGRWRSGVPIHVILPFGDAARPAPADWFANLYAQMQWARRGPPPLYRLQDGRRIDIGILDIQIALHADDGTAARLIEDGTFAREHDAFLDRIAGGRIRPPMVYAAALHRHHSSGKLHHHCHNLIFGLRKEIGEDGTGRIGAPDWMPLIDALNDRHDQAVVAGRKSG